jgi:hypothetical protein
VIIEHKEIKQLQFVVIQIKHGGDTTDRVSFAFPLYLSLFAESMGTVYNPSSVAFLLKTDDLYEVVMCNDVKETLVLPTTDTYTFCLSTNVQPSEIISPMETPLHLHSIRFSDYNDGKITEIHYSYECTTIALINTIILVSEIRYFPVLLM